MRHAPRAPGAFRGKRARPAARAKVEPRLRELCRAADLAYPPDAIYLRVFKQEAEVEVWARMKRQPFRLLMTIPITHSSGKPGPKRKEGDRQVPEGFYAIDLFNPVSDFHLSMRINYPNESDRILSDPAKPGQRHLSARLGRLHRLSAARRREDRGALHSRARHARRRAELDSDPHFPRADERRKMGRVLQGTHRRRRAARAFWKSLKTGYDAFEQNHEVPKMKVAPDGSYRLER